MNPDEENLWRAIQKKDRQAFDAFYKLKYKTFFLAAFGYLKDAGLAEETVNDVFIKLWETAATVQIESSVIAYIYRAVVNRSLDVMDKNKRHQLHQKEISRLPEGRFEWREMEENELKVRLYEAIDRLPEQCQRVFKLSRFEGLKQQEIADELNISIKTVKNHITHALKQLQTVLNDWNTLLILFVVLTNFF